MRARDVICEGWQVFDVRYFRAVGDLAKTGAVTVTGYDPNVYGRVHVRVNVELAA